MFDAQNFGQFIDQHFPNFWISLEFIAVLIILYFYIKRKYGFWHERGIAGPAPSLLTFGNVATMRGSNSTKLELELHSKYGKVYGVYNFLEPVLTVADPELAKQILIKDFPSFVNRSISLGYHEWIHQDQFFVESEKWKRLRAISGPVFTSAKLKTMMPLMNRCIDKLIDNLDKQCLTNGGVIDVKEVATGLSLDVILSTVFAIETNEIFKGKQRNNSDVVTNAIEFFEIYSLRQLCYLCMPRWFNNLFRVRHPFNVNSVEFLGNLASQIVKQRKQANLAKHVDLVQLLIDSSVSEEEVNTSNFDRLTASMDNEDSAKKVNSTSTTKHVLSESEVIAQCLGFLFAGFETSSAAISACIFELVRNPEVQERLMNELNFALNGLDVNSSEYYETVTNKIPYLEAVLKETLRKHPAGTRLERRLNVDKYQIGNVTLKRDQIVQVAVYAIHYNPEYYPEPDRFDPSRFMPENKHLLVPNTFLTFGAGPRNCVGMRFAYQEMKLALARIVQNYSFKPTVHTPQALKYKSLKFTLNFHSFSVKIEKN